MNRLIPQRTREQIRQQVGFLMFGRDRFTHGVCATGTVGTTSILYSNAQRWNDDFFTGATLYTANTNQQRLITNHVGAELTVAPSFLPPVEDGDRIEIWPAGTDPDAINANINLATIRASDIVNIYQELPFASIDSGRMFGTLPLSFVKISGFHYFEDGLLYDFAPQTWIDTQAYRGYTLRGNRVYFNEALSESVGDANIFVEGYRLPVLLDDDADISEVRPDYLTFVAAAYMEGSQAEGPSLDPEQHGARATQWMKEALAIEPRMITGWRPNSEEVVA